jgi:TetR/AcrR family transcriptional regulator, lmrAB and yxaGH operons repressor
MNEPEPALREHRTKSLMIRAAADLMQRRGYVGTGVAEILLQAGAPRGSLYHHFPGGKREIALEAIAYTRHVFARDLEKIAADSNSLDAYFDALATLSKRDLLASDFDASCPIAATALDVPCDEHDIFAACSKAFDHWALAIGTGLSRHHTINDNSSALGKLFLNALFGAVMSARVARNTQVIDTTLDQLKLLMAQSD